VPGNRCVGGVDLNPAVYSCSYSGLLLSHTLKARNLFFLAILIALCYYGYPYLEGIIILLPLPDPKDTWDNIKAIFVSARGEVLKKGYKAGFGSAPESL